jgi:hypothetical protein
MALAMAQRLQERGGDLERQIDRAFRLVFGRLPSDAERTKAAEHVARMLAHHRRVSPAAPAPRQRVVRSLIGELTGQRIDFEEDGELENYQPNPRPSDVSPETRALAELCLVLLNSNEFIYLH